MRTELPDRRTALSLGVALTVGLTLAGPPATACVGSCFWATDGGQLCLVDSCGASLASVPMPGVVGNVGGLSVSGDGTQIWIVTDSPGSVYRLDCLGAVQQTFDLPEIPGQPTGIALDTSSVWIAVDPGSVYEYSTSGTLLGFFSTIACEAVPVGVARDPSGGSVWVLGETGGLCEHSASSGAHLRHVGVSAYCPNPGGLDRVGSEFWIVDGVQNSLCRVHDSGTQIQLLETVTIGCTGATGVSVGSGSCTQCSATGIETVLFRDETEGPSLDRSWPDPFSGATSVLYSLPQAGRVRLSVHDVAGRKVATLVAGAREAGTHTVTWNARDAGGRPAASGVYFLRLSIGEESDTRRVHLRR